MSSIRSSDSTPLKRGVQFIISRMLGARRQITSCLELIYHLYDLFSTEIRAVTRYKRERHELCAQLPADPPADFNSESDELKDVRAQLARHHANQDRIIREYGGGLLVDHNWCSYADERGTCQWTPWGIS